MRRTGLLDIVILLRPLLQEVTMRRTMSSVITMALLAAFVAALLSVVMVGLFYALYLHFLTLGLSPKFAALAIAGTAAAIALLACLAAKIRLHYLRRTRLPSLTDATDIVSSFMDGLRKG